MTAQPLPALTSGDPSAWDQALYAFLVEKGNRSGSRRTVESYSRMLWPFFADLGKAPDRVKPADVLAWVHGIGRSGRTPSSTTVGARIACLSSFYRFLIRMGLLVSNPCDAVERPRSVQSTARGYSADEVRKLLGVVPDTVAGRRDRAILLTLVLTGRRRSEVIGLRAGDLSLEVRFGSVAESIVLPVAAERELVAGRVAFLSRRQPSTDATDTPALKGRVVASRSPPFGAGTGSETVTAPTPPTNAPRVGQRDPLIAALARYVEALDRRYPDGPDQMRSEALDARANMRRMRKNTGGRAA
jgi:Site-specific recombinase XerD